MVATDGWDYIIIGGGLAGCVVASRLKEYQSSARILVIEAGPDVSDNKDILYHSTLNFVGGKFDWGYKSVPQKHYNGRKIDIPAGRAVGGGSVINACGWLRGARADYDSWGEIVGDQRWTYDGQLPYLKMTEKWYKTENSEFHGQDGKLNIESPISTGRIFPLSDIGEQAYTEIGVKRLPGNEINAGENIGIGELNENRSKGARQIAPLVYPLDGVTVLPNTLVESVIIDAGTAVGARLADGTEIRSSGVIVSAGAYRTPQVLMLSGIGPKEVLEEHGIQVKVDNPQVGKNFNDHVMMQVNWKLKDPSKGYAIGSANALFAEPQFRAGAPISQIACTGVPRGGLEAAIIKDESEIDQDHYLLKRSWAVMESMLLYLSFPPIPVDGTHISTALMAMKPTSRGTVTIASKNPADAPILDPNYYATEVDKYVWRHSMRSIATLLTGDTVLGRDIVENETPPPGFDEPLTPNSSDEYIDSRIKAQGISTFHGSSSCSMGEVVDNDLRVRGVKNLWIADASVFPISIGAHIQAAVYALAEQAAFIITHDKSG
ncbi:GMC oxidoreductase [Hypoxylon trugodes]|uniref:GMC oxidoreductase n=1 Tax=Hypoxylon trugodes TaxID=326681 RepID=UPI002194DD1E|nr:GMC oxidoreductase [Hypoxylon trugodes]KAI1393935.1 GMC oxidoreductase [Hypoxylon trugodes]